MVENNEIKALLHLIDDPDEEIYASVSNKLISFGKAIIPNLEHLWENVNSEAIQTRIELLIHQLHFRDLTDEFKNWIESDQELLKGALIISKYHHPDISTAYVYKEVEKLRRNIWLELNNYLTPIEKISVFNSIFYNYYKQTGVEISYENPDQFIINKVLENKTGNTLSNGIIYLTLCDLLDLPVNAIQIPQHFLLGYFDDYFDLLNPELNGESKIAFYIDPISGQMYSNKDVEQYLKKLKVEEKEVIFQKMDNKKIINLFITEMSKCYENENNIYKYQELLSLSKLLSP